MSDTPTRIHHFLDHQQCARPHAPALRGADGGRITYGDLAAITRTIAADLAGRGLRPGDRLLIVGENCAALVAVVMACSRFDAVPVPVNARMTAPELATIAAHADARLTVHLTHASAPAEAHAAAAGATVWPTAIGDLAITPARPDATAEPASPGAAQTAVILYTTGSTGTPKGVMLTHGNLIFAGQTSARMRGMVPDDLILGVLPMTHVFGLTSMMLAAICAGAELWLFPRFAAPDVLAALRAGVSVLPAVPQMHALVMAAAGTAEPLPRLRYVSSGAAPLDPEWKRRAEAFYGVALQNGYGMTETTAGVTLTDSPMGLPDTSVGAPLPGVELRLRGIGPDGVGEIQTRGPHVMPGYFRNPEATAAMFDADGFLCTGDLGRIDADGRLHIAGRSRELIIRGGFNIYPPEVEAALNDHPAVIQTAVIGRRLPGGNEDVLAFCQTRAPVTEAELSAHAATRLSAYKRPCRIIVTDSLPVASNGKVLKQRLAQMFADQLAPPGATLPEV